MSVTSSAHATTVRPYRRCALCAALTASTLLPSMRVDAGQVRAQMQVSATVTEAVTWRQIHQAQTIAVTERDVSSGYVDALSASRFELSGNVYCSLEYRPVDHVFRNVTARIGDISSRLRTLEGRWSSQGMERDVSLWR